MYLALAGAFKESIGDIQRIGKELKEKLGRKLVGNQKGEENKQSVQTAIHIMNQKGV